MSIARRIYSPMHKIMSLLRDEYARQTQLTNFEKKRETQMYLIYTHNKYTRQYPKFGHFSMTSIHVSRSWLTQKTHKTQTYPLCLLIYERI